jgi:hypothetical protein
VDLGSSHSFVSAQVADQLQGVTPSMKPSQVRVVNGSVAELLQASWSVQGYEFHTDLKVLILQNFDMILGMD